MTEKIKSEATRVASLKFLNKLSPVSSAKRANEVGSFDNQSGNDCDESDGNEERLQLPGCFGGHDCSFECPCIKAHTLWCLRV